MATSVRQSVRIRAKRSVVWATLVDPSKIVRWMGGAHVESTWHPGDAISFAGTFHDRPYQDRGTVLACDPERLLRYSHWSALSRLPDSKGTRAVVTLTLQPNGDETDLEVRHDNLSSYAALGHARFFWRNALNDVKDIAESESSLSSCIVTP
jgi:uncharacterized protein YndB with AHSA1/START domain